jgi:hypothetical protein
MNMLEELHNLNPWPGEALSGAEQSEPARRLLGTVLTSQRPHRVFRAVLAKRTTRRRMAGIAVVPIVAAVVVVFLVVLPTKPIATTPGRQSLWRLVSVQVEPFRSVPAGPGEPGLQCVTDTVCYTPSANFHSNELYRTTDGGQTWTATTPVPVPQSVRGTLTAFRCTSANTCMVLGRAPSQAPDATGELAITNDGGTTWRTDVIPAPSGLTDSSAERIACGDDTHCVVSVNGRATGSGVQAGTFITTTNEGATWVQSALPVDPEAADIWNMTCDPSGACIALSVLTTSGVASSLVALHSADWGQTWTTGAPTPAHPGILKTSCGDDLQCLLIEIGGSGNYQVVRTSNGGLSWRVEGPPAGWGNIPTAVSCANGHDCWVAVSTYTSKAAYTHPVVEQTSDAGTTWASLSLPVAHPAIADVLSLSCPPTGDGCMAIGNLADHFESPASIRGKMLSPPFVISSLPQT